MHKTERPVVKQTANFSTHLGGIQLPKGAVYVKLPQQVINGRFYPVTYAWVTDLQMALKQQHFYVIVLTAQDKRPHREYMDGMRGYAKLLKNFILALPNDKLAVEMGGRQLRHILPQAPHDREIPQPMQRMRESYFTDPDVITDADAKPVLVV